MLVEGKDANLQLGWKRRKTRNLWENDRKRRERISVCGTVRCRKFDGCCLKRKIERGRTSLLFLVPHTQPSSPARPRWLPQRPAKQHIQPTKIHPGSLFVSFMFAALQKWSLIHPPTVSVCFFIEPRSAACTLPCCPFLLLGPVFPPPASA